MKITRLAICQAHWIVWLRAATSRSRLFPWFTCSNAASQQY